MRWRARAVHSRAKERANISFFIFIMFFAVVGIIILTELLLLERPSLPARSHYDDLQHWAAKTEKLVSEVTEPAPPAQIALDGVWQPVGGTRFRFYVFAAYMERRTVGAVRVIAATKTRGSDPVICRLWLPNNRTVVLKAKVQAIRENWNLKYSAMYVLCLLRDSGVKPQDTVGASIAVISSLAPNRPPTNLLLVQNTEPKPGTQDSLHVCVKPLHFLYHRDEWLVEWLEVNRLLGVSHFYMYNKSVSPRVGCVLKHYQRQGLVTLLPWKLPMISQVEIRTEGQFAAFNDCLYRSMSKAGWLMPIDTDEVVFPRRVETIPALLANLSHTIKLPSRKPAAFLFRNAFFYTRWEDDPDSPVPLLTSLKTRRLTTPHALKNRSKYVVRARDVVELGNHFVWEHAPGANSVGVPIESGILHHYRVNCEFDGDQCLKLPSTVDRTAHRWSNKLWQKVQAEQKRIDEGTRILSVNHSLARAVQWALEAGYRHIDTASLYRTEEEVGRGIRDYIRDNDASRTDVYVTTKLWNDAHERDEVIPALKRSLHELQLDYVDLYLMHYPFAYKKDGSVSLTDYLETWKGLEDAKDKNLTRSIGVSNFNVSQMHTLWDNARIKPAVLQIEVNPTITQEELVNWCNDHGVVVMAYSPFGAILGRKKDAPAPRTDHPTLQSIAKKYKKSVPQILLRYLIDRRLVAIPRSTNKDRIKENIDIFDFSLTQEEVLDLSAFNSNYRLRTPAKWYPHPFFPFEKKNLTASEIQYIIEHSKDD